jgi:hypothetical protein
MTAATLAPVATERILVGVGATLTAKFRDQYGEPAARNAVTVGVVDANGTEILAAGTAATYVGASTSYTVAISAVTDLAFLTATWTSTTGSVSTETTVEVVGGYYFSIADTRAYKNGVMSSAATYSDALIRATRDEVEREFERVIWPQVPRYRRIELPATGGNRLALPDMHIRDVRSVREYDETSTLAYTWTAGDISGLRWDASGEVVSQNGKPFGWRAGKIVVEYEYGFNQPSADVLAAAFIRLRHRMNADKSGIPDRAMSYTHDGGGTYSLSTPGRGTAVTGIPDVDAVLNDPRFRRPLVGIA